MTDTPKIEPALTPLEWSEALNWPHGVVDYLISPAERVGFGEDSPNDLAALIALANAALPNDDRRKITREKLFALHEVLANFRAFAATQGDFGAGLIAQYAPDVEQLEAALESYLPPES